MTSNSPAHIPPRHRRGALLLGIGSVALVAVAALCFAYGDSILGQVSAVLPVSEDHSAPMDKYFAVKRGEFNITVLVDGTLNAIKRHDLRCEAKGGMFQLSITEVVEDRKEVKTGDLIVRFSDEEYKSQLDKFKLELENAERDLILAREDLSMRTTTNRSDLKSALDKVTTAEEALQKYRDLDAPKERKAKQTAITEAEQKLTDADSLVSTARQALAESQDPTQAEDLEAKLGKAEDDLVTAQKAMDDANHNYRVFKQYDFPQKMRSLEEGVVQAHLNLRKAFVDAKSRVVQAERTIQSHEKRIEASQENIKRLEEDIAKLVICAPVDGIVTLGNPNRRHWQEPKEIKVGEIIHPQEVVASLPDLSKFEVAVDIPEEYRSRIREGLTAKLRSPAVPDLVMEGKIATIAPMATNLVPWDNNSPKIYATKINTDMSDTRLMPGMTVKVEIIVESASGVLFIPVEAAFNREGKTLCQVKARTAPKARGIETGRSSIHFVEVLSGLDEGEKVLLHRRPGEGGQ